MVWPSLAEAAGHGIPSRTSWHPFGPARIFVHCRPKHRHLWKPPSEFGTSQQDGSTETRPAGACWRLVARPSGGSTCVVAYTNWTKLSFGIFDSVLYIYILYMYNNYNMCVYVGTQVCRHVGLYVCVCMYMFVCICMYLYVLYIFRTVLYVFV